MCPWVLEMLSKNSSKNNFDLFVFPQSIECLVLLHLPFIIDMKELAKQDDEGHYGKRDDNNFSRGDETNMNNLLFLFCFYDRMHVYKARRNLLLATFIQCFGSVQEFP